VWVLVYQMHYRHASLKSFQDADYVSSLWMFILTSPLSFIGVLLAQRTGLDWWPYPENHARTIVAIWSYLFAMGALQWFVLIPWIVHKGFDLYDRLAISLRKHPKH
jgi:hypothetical protein